MGQWKELKTKTRRFHSRYRQTRERFKRFIGKVHGCEAKGEELKEL